VAPKSEPPSWPALAVPANARSSAAIDNLFINLVVDFEVLIFVGSRGLIDDSR
jgi:hypothetical protein